MWATIVGNIRLLRSGSAIVPPFWTESRTSSIARSRWTLPAVAPVISIACRIGTPACTRPEKVRDQRASAILWIASPILAGIFSLIVSHCAVPISLFFHFLIRKTMPTVPAMSRYHRRVRGARRRR